MSQTQDIIDRLLQASANGTPAAMTDTDASDYDWTASHHFSTAQIQQLTTVAQDAARKLSEALRKALRTEITLVAEQVAGRYAKDIKEKSPDTGVYCLGLDGAGGQRGGLIAVAGAAAVDWVSALLGGGGGSGGGREMSKLEVSLLEDVVSSLAGGFCESFGASGGAALSVSGQLGTDIAGLLGEDSEEYCWIGFRLEEAEGDIALWVAVVSDAADEALGGRHEQAKTPEQMRQEVLACMMHAPIKATVELGTTQATIRDIAAVEAGDVLVLDRRVDEPVELLVQGKTISAGYLAKAEGRYAVRLAQGLASDGGR